jgi:hypothetical protein
MLTIQCISCTRQRNGCLGQRLRSRGPFRTDCCICEGVDIKDIIRDFVQIPAVTKEQKPRAGALTMSYEDCEHTRNDVAAECGVMFLFHI